MSGWKEQEANDDGLTAEEKIQLRELCVLIVISEFLETDKNTELYTTRSQGTRS